MQALIVVGGLAITLVANALLLRRAVAPLERLAQRMETVDLLRPGSAPSGRAQRRGRPRRRGLQPHARPARARAAAERPAGARRAGGRAYRDRPRPARRGRPAADRRAAAAELDRRDSARRTAQEIDEAREAVRRALDEVRRISSELRPEMLEHLGLVSALTELSTTFARVSGVRGRAPVRRRRCRQLARRCRARRLPHRPGEPDERRPSCAGDPRDDRARARPRQRRPPRRRRRPRLRRCARGARRSAQHARAGALDRRRAGDQRGCRRGRRGASRSSGRAASAQAVAVE